jgi:ArsR family transcriptional regulator, cadmium/lead-responsive transcriptional repressor
MFIRANPKSIEVQAKLFRGFSDPSRLSILDALQNGAPTVSEIVTETGLTQSNVSNHLACLRAARCRVDQSPNILFHRIAVVKLN